MSKARRQQLALALVVVTGATCAGSSRHHSAYEARDLKHQEILNIDLQIQKDRRDMGLADRPDAKLVRAFQLKAVLPPPPEGLSASDECREICDLAEHICKAQEDICRIASELPPDDEWAQEKCASAKASCSEARKRCTDCR